MSPLSKKIARHDFHWEIKEAGVTEPPAICRPSLLHKIGMESGESFGSWLRRLASANETSIKELARHFGLPPIMSDIDFVTDDDWWKLMADILGDEGGVSKSRDALSLAQDMSKSPYFDALTKHGRWRVSRYCPECLASGVPYWRSTWRLSFVLACPKHRTWLLAHCPHCGYVSTDSVRYQAWGQAKPGWTLCHCLKCRSDLRDQMPLRLRARFKPDQLLDVQETFWQTVQLGRWGDGQPLTGDAEHADEAIRAALRREVVGYWPERSGPVPERWSLVLEQLYGEPAARMVEVLLSVSRTKI